MKRRNQRIPIYTLPSGSSDGIMIIQESFDGSIDLQDIGLSHRDSGYTFILQQKGQTRIEIDFQNYRIEAPSVVFIHPDQVHRVLSFESATISSWMITEENMNKEYLHLLNAITPADVLAITPEILSILSETTSVCLRLFERKEEKIYNTILKDSINSLTGLIASQYLSKEKTTAIYSRPEIITRSFKKILEQNFRISKSPAVYAGILNISTSYLNECVKTTTGKSVSNHIQQRVILEAKRLFYHSNMSAKEAATELGYDDYSYFTRLFVKIVGITPLNFRNKNHD